ncbi:MAG TPA: hypothetical protein VD978_15180 [Azospirillum sp.]|nr:hypothetical protein [Azospirillum sp.]
MTQTNRRDRDRSYERPGAGVASVSWMAWIVSGIGLLLFLGAVGVLGYEGLFRSTGDPVIVLSVEDVSHDGTRWHARIRAENTGGSTGARVRVVGYLMSGSTVVETAEVEFDYLPAGSTQRGGLFFDRNALTHELRLRVLGYAAP